jgi:hypothetical protein
MRSQHIYIRGLLSLDSGKAGALTLDRLGVPGSGKGRYILLEIEGRGVGWMWYSQRVEGDKVWTIKKRLKNKFKKKKTM